MNSVILAAGLLCLISCSYSQNICDSIPGASCKGECGPNEAENTRYGIIACIKVPNTKCCQAEETTTPEPTTTTEMPTTEPPTTTETTTTAEPTTSTVPPPPPPQEQCGISNSPAITARIFNGVENVGCDWPWMVSIRSKGLASHTIGNAAPSCSGVLIESNWVVTTAFCVLKSAYAVGGADTASNIFVFAGEHNTGEIDYRNNQATEQTFGVAQVIIHEDYPHKNPTTLDFSLLSSDEEGNNIALLKLDRDVVYGDCVRKVCLPEAPVAGSCPTLIKDCWTAGWGVGPANKNILNEAELTIVGAEAWKAHAQLSGLNGNLKPLTLNGSFKNITARACTDDNGGMVVCKKDATSWVLEGLINKPNFDDCKAATSTNNVVLTDITAALDWIRGNIAN